MRSLLKYSYLYSFLVVGFFISMVATATGPYESLASETDGLSLRLQTAQFELTRSAGRSAQSGDIAHQRSARRAAAKYANAAKLPRDVPVYPNMSLIAEDYNPQGETRLVQSVSNSSFNRVRNFYEKSTKREGWRMIGYEEFGRSLELSYRKNDGSSLTVNLSRAFRKTIVTVFNTPPV